MLPSTTVNAATLLPWYLVHISSFLLLKLHQRKIRHNVNSYQNPNPIPLPSSIVMRERDDLNVGIDEDGELPGAVDESERLDQGPRNVNEEETNEATNEGQYDDNEAIKEAQHDENETSDGGKLDENDVYSLIHSMNQDKEVTDGGENDDNNVSDGGEHDENENPPTKTNIPSQVPALIESHRLMYTRSPSEGTSSEPMRRTYSIPRKQDRDNVSTNRVQLREAE
ncbi:uncharacterized protein A4U43_C03F28290 [Asparagus officinalis]|uniref:Uncharacterized protein n=1 Tax=Asparagus officinalis TaxID=4686 RepID=A0A5P1FIQ8_ASPOF|nr:uncharacterized protein A4U43_C03F28290 [Asparagus officinalis]